MTVWLDICPFRLTNKRAMTDIDFRRLASLLFALKLIGRAADPVDSGIDLADRLLQQLQQNE